jgi:hypothetical protein
VDLRAPLNHIIDLARVVKALDQTCLILLSKVAKDEANWHRMSTMLSEFNDTHGDAPTELIRDLHHNFTTIIPGQI